MKVVTTLFILVFALLLVVPSVSAVGLNEVCSDGWFGVKCDVGFICVGGICKSDGSTPLSYDLAYEGDYCNSKTLCLDSECIDGVCVERVNFWISSNECETDRDCPVGYYCADPWPYGDNFCAVKVDDSGFRVPEAEPIPASEGGYSPGVDYCRFDSECLDLNFFDWDSFTYVKYYCHEMGFCSLEEFPDLEGVTCGQYGQSSCFDTQECIDGQCVNILGLGDFCGVESLSGYNTGICGDELVCKPEGYCGYSSFGEGLKDGLANVGEGLGKGIGSLFGAGAGASIESFFKTIFEKYGFWILVISILLVILLFRNFFRVLLSFIPVVGKPASRMIP